MSLPSKSMRSVRALGVPCPRRSPGPVNNGKDFHISLSLSCDDSWYDFFPDPYGIVHIPISRVTLTLAPKKATMKHKSPVHWCG